LLAVSGDSSEAMMTRDACDDRDVTPAAPTVGVVHFPAYW